MKFEDPDKCGMCHSVISAMQFGNRFICGMPVSKEKQMIDITAFEVSLDSRPNWCPKKKVADAIDSLSEEGKERFDKACEGFSALFELMDNMRRLYGG